MALQRTRGLITLNKNLSEVWSSQASNFSSFGNLQRKKNISRGSLKKSSPFQSPTNIVYPTYYKSFSSTVGSNVEIQASPQQCLQDVHTTLIVKGLPPNSPITMRAEVYDDFENEYYSIAHYTSNSKGQINLDKDPSRGGSYKGVFPEGLISSAMPGKHTKTHARLIHQHVFDPVKYTITAHEGTTDNENLGPKLAEVVLHRYFTVPGVKRIPIKEGKLRGTLFLPPGEGPFPAVLDMWGGMGGLVEFRAAITAARGIASYALPYYNYDDLPSGPETLDSSFVADAADLLLKRPEVIPDRCGIISHCLGSFFGLHATACHDKIKCLAGISTIGFGLGVRTHFNGRRFTKTIDPHFDTADFIDNKYLVYKKDLYTQKYQSVDSEYLFPMEVMPEDKKILLSAGTEDTYYTMYANRAMKERSVRAGKDNVEIIEYEGAGHILEVPYGPLVLESYQPYYPFRKHAPKNLPGKKGVFMYWGGSSKPNCEAQVDWWERSRNFILKNVRDESEWYQKYLKGEVKFEQN